jgi:hypothetical protein
MTTLQRTTAKSLLKTERLGGIKLGMDAMLSHLYLTADVAFAADALRIATAIIG